MVEECQADRLVDMEACLGWVDLQQGILHLHQVETVVMNSMGVVMGEVEDRVIRANREVEAMEGVVADMVVEVVVDMGVVEDLEDMVVGDMEDMVEVVA